MTSVALMVVSRSHSDCTEVKWAVWNNVLETVEIVVHQYSPTLNTYPAQLSSLQRGRRPLPGHDYCSGAQAGAERHFIYHEGTAEDVLPAAAEEVQPASASQRWRPTAPPTLESISSPPSPSGSCCQCQSQEKDAAYYIYCREGDWLPYSGTVHL